MFNPTIKTVARAALVLPLIAAASGAALAGEPQQTRQIKLGGKEPYTVTIPVAGAAATQPAEQPYALQGTPAPTQQEEKTQPTLRPVVYWAGPHQIGTAYEYQAK